MRAKDNLPVALFCHTLMFNSALIKGGDSCVPFPSLGVGVLVADTQPSLHHRALKNSPPANLPLFSTRTWPFKIPKDLCCRDHTENSVPVSTVTMRGVPVLSCCPGAAAHPAVPAAIPADSSPGCSLLPCPLLHNRHPGRHLANQATVKPVPVLA